MSDTFVVKYDGGDADSHQIDMRLLGESLQGLERLVSDILIIGSQKRLPRKGERAPLVIKAHEPREGTFNLPITIQETIGAFQLGWQIFGPNGAEVVSDWIKSGLLFNLGKTSEAEQAMKHLVDLAQSHKASGDMVEDHRHQEMMLMIDLMRQNMPRTEAPMLQAAAPIGRSVSRLWLFAGKQATPRLEIAKDDAEALRAKAELEWTRPEEWTLQTDGFSFHNRRLTVQHPHGSGFFSAEVSDPVAEVESNPYAAAMQRKALIRVTAKAAYRGDQLERLVIYDFGGEIDQHS